VLIDLIRFVQGFALPPGLLVVFGLAAAAVLRHPGVRRTLLAASLLLYLAALPWPAALLLHRLEWTYAPPGRVTGQALVVLGEGASRGIPVFPGSGALSAGSSMELLTALALYRRTHRPIIFSGGTGDSAAGNEALTAGRELVALGVPASALLLDPNSHTTYENAADVAAILRAHGWRRITLIVSAFHAPRAVRDFQLFGVQVQPYPTDYQTPRQLRFSWLSLSPSASALSWTATALNEWLAMALTRAGLRL
jgi:uncharacterized SAM-binding protein YcdF (DUF218 family)